LVRWCPSVCELLVSLVSHVSWGHHAALRVVDAQVSKQCWKACLLDHVVPSRSWFGVTLVMYLSLFCVC